MSEKRESVEGVLTTVRDLPPEARQEILGRLASMLDLPPEEVAWLRLAEPSFEFWDNPEDAVYDDL